MNKLALVLISTTALLIGGGCGSKQKAKTASPRVEVPAGQSRPQGEQNRAAATAELREALLHLRRVHFAFDTDRLLPRSRTALEEAADALRKHPDVQIYIDGHTDARGTAEYNVALGERRANAAADYLARLGVDPARLHVVSFGKEQPWDDADGTLANAKNRRAEFRLYRGDVRLVLDDGTLYDDRGTELESDR